MKNTVKAYVYLTIVGTLATIIDFYCLLIGIFASIWFPFLIWTVLEIGLGIWVSYDYYKNFKYICPVCGEIFKPKSFKEFFFSKHRLGERSLECPKCLIEGMCDEIHVDDI
jgi:hypothetical protein